MLMLEVGFISDQPICSADSARYIVIYQSQLGCWHYEKLISYQPMCNLYQINLCANNDGQLGGGRCC